MPQREMAGRELGAEETPAEPRHWLLQCDGVEPGRVVGYLDAAHCEQQPHAVGTLDTGLTWYHRGTQDPRSPERKFTLTPLTEAEATEREQTAASTRPNLRTPT